MEISRLRVGNEDFLVSSMIDRCPKSMMLRELIKNALEAAANAIVGGSRVELSPVMVEGGRKLAIWNTGPGMDANELYRMCDIASSIGKQNALDENFGMGAKVASLPSNHHGIRYRSCKAGRVHQVVMGKRDLTYGRLRQIGPDGAASDVLDVTDQAAAEGADLGIDWTQVVLLGQRPDHDTVAAPYDGDPGMPADWIAETLYTRFFTMPASIALILRDGCNVLGGDQRFVPIGQRTDAFERYEAVPIERGITLHYFYDPPNPDAPGRLMSARGALQSAQSSAGLIYRDEIYDFRPPWAWLHEAPVFGLPFGARNISVYAQLPDDFPLLPDGYRQFLRHSHNLQHHVQTREFANLVLRHRPAWLLELLRRFAPDAKHTDHLHGEVASLFKSLGVRRRWWPPGGDDEPPPPGGEEWIEYEVAPQISVLRDEADIHERGMHNKAARFYRETHQVFVNATYTGFNSFRETLEQEFAAAEDQEQMRLVAQTLTEEALTRQICRKLVFGLSKREVWHDWEVDQATSMYSLTTAADDNAALLQEVREEMGRRLGITDTQSSQKAEQARERLATAMQEIMALRPQFQGKQPFEMVLRF